MSADDAMPSTHAAAPATDRELWSVVVDADSSRQSRRRAKRVADLLRTTAVVVADKGYTSANLDDIAERLDLGKASIYHYFDGKEALVYACLDECATHVAGRLAAIADGPGGAPARLEEMIHEQLEVTCVEHPELSHLFLHPLDWPPRLEDALRGWRREHDDLFKRVIAEGIADGTLAPHDARVARMCLHGALNDVPTWLHGDATERRERIGVITSTVMAMFRPKDP